MEAWEQGLHLQFPLQVASGGILSETKHTIDVVQVATATTPLSRLERPELPFTFCDTSVEDHESESCNIGKRLSTTAGGVLTDQVTWQTSACSWRDFS